MSFEIENIFHEVCGLAPNARAEFFLSRQIPDELRRQVESLLEHDGPTDSPLIRRVAARAEAWVRQRADNVAFGPFRLQRHLGGGGMGDVYLAERVDGEVQHTVAIKLLRFGTDSPELKERFLRERQILASLRHEGIAHFLDAGHSEDGRPFFVMEYVDGEAIDVYCAKLSLRPKLELFLQVCEAVSYAHRNLVVHRDIKPSNILVDASGRVKLLDFGIARILDETTSQTSTRERMLTPEYASPEQVRGMAQSTSTDVYSLGAVLYKLLTGEPPHKFIPGSGEQIEWVICNRDSVSAIRVNPALPKDLDFIVGMALRKEPESRYASVEMLMEDIRAYLEFRPVRARSMDAWYRARKLVRRYWLPVAAASIAIAGLSAGLLVAHRERAVAERRFNDVRDLSNKLLDIDVIVRQLPGAASARQFIVNTSLDYLRRLSKDAAEDPGLALELGTAYMRIGRVQGVPIATNLGQTDEAEGNLRTAEALIQAVLAAQPTNRTAILRAAQIAHDRMILAQERRPATEALPLAKASAQWLDKYHSRGDAGAQNPQHAEAAVIVGMNVANWLSHESLFEESNRILRQAIDVATATHQTRQAGAARIILARTLRASGELDAALAAIREGTSLLRPAEGEKQTGPLATYGLALVTEGEILGEDQAVSLERPQEAAPLFERGYRIVVEQARQDEKDALSRLAVSNRGFRLAGVLRRTDPVAALRVYDEVLRYAAEVKSNPRARRGEVRSLCLSATVLVGLGRPVEARRRIDAAFSRLRDMNLYPSAVVGLESEAADALRASALHAAAMGDVAQAIQTYNQLLTKGMASKPSPESSLDTAFRLSELYSGLATLYLRSGQRDPAAALASRRVELWRNWERKLPRSAFVAKQLALAQRSSS